MSTATFEDELRTLLHVAADAEAPAFVDLAPDEVLAQGRRVVRRRRLVTGAGIAAAVVALGLVGFSFRDTHDLTSGPAGSTSASTGTVDALLTRNTQVGEQWGPADGHSGARATVDLNTGQVTFDSFRDGEPQAFGTAEMPTSTRGSTWVTSDAVPGLVIGVLPAAAKDISFMWAGNAPVSTYSTALLPGTGYQAFALWHDGAKSDTMFAGLDWSDGSRVYDSAGSPLQSARAGDSVVFVDRAQAQFGIFADGSIVTKQLSVAPSGLVPVVTSGRQEDGSSTMSSTALLVLPSGARDVRLTPTAGTTVDSLVVVPGGSTADTLVVARLTLARSDVGTGIERATWVNPDGSAGAGTPGD